jgi:hypothetical protein
MCKREELETNFEAAYIPLPSEMVEARRASLLLLLEWVREDILENEEVAE